MSLPRRFNLRSQVRAKVGKLVHQQILNQALLRETKHQLIIGAYVSTVVKSTTNECLCYHELNVCEYFKIKRLYVYLLPVLQIFFIKLINKHAIINLFLIHNTKRRKVFFRIFFILFLVSQFLYCIMHNIRT